MLDTIESNTIKLKAIFITTIKFCITFQLRLSKEIASKSKVLLQLTQLKANKFDTLNRA